MSELPDIAKLMLSKRVKKQMEFKEGKSIEMKKLEEGEWASKIKALWSQHFNQESKKKYDIRQPFIDEHGACIVLLMSKPFDPKMNKNDKYQGSFEYLLQCDDTVDFKKYITIFDSKENLFEEWYFRNGKALTRIAYLRGALETKYRNPGDETTWGVKEDAYVKKRGVASLSEIEVTSYERLFQMNLWEILEIQHPGVD